MVVALIAELQLVGELDEALGGVTMSDISRSDY